MELTEVINSSMTTIVIERLFPANITESSNNKLLPKEQGSSLVNICCYPNQINEEYYVPMVRGGSKHWRNFYGNNVFKKVDLKNIKIAETRGAEGFTFDEVIDNYNSVKREITKKIGTSDFIIVFEIDEILTQWSTIPNAVEAYLKPILTKHYVLVSELYEPTLGQIDGLFNMYENLPTLQKSVVNTKEWPDVFDEYNFKPKGMFIYHTNFAVNKKRIRHMYESILSEYNIHVLDPAPGFWNQIVSFKGNHWDRNAHLEKIKRVLKENNYEKLFISMHNKPRTYRIRHLADLDKHDLLKRGDWSLGYDKSKPYVWGNKRLLDIKFLTKYDNVLPKGYDGINTLDSKSGFIVQDSEIEKDPWYSPKEWCGKYKWWFVVETTGYHRVDTMWATENAYQEALSKIRTEIGIYSLDKTLISEKTFKVFAAGMIPIIIDTSGIVDDIEAMGFQLPWCRDLAYDHLPSFEERSKKCVEEFLKIMDSPLPENYKEAIIHNYNHMFDNDALVSNMLRPLYKILDYDKN